MQTVSNTELARIGGKGSNLDFKDKMALLKEMDEAMQRAKQFSNIVDQLLKDALHKCGPSKEMLDKMTDARNSWSIEMARHRKAYKLYHNIPETRAPE